MATLETDTSFAGVGNLVVRLAPDDGDLLEAYLAVAHLLDQVKLQDPEAGPKSFTLEASESSQSIEVSPQDIDLTVGRFVDQAIALFEQRIQGFADSEDYTTLASISGDFSSLGAIVARLDGAESLTGSIKQLIKASFDDLTTAYTDAITTAINDLTEFLEGDGFDADTDLGTFVAISDAIALLNDDDATEGSVAFAVKEAFDDLTTAYGAAIQTAINNLTTTLQGTGFNAQTDLGMLIFTEK